MLSDYKTPAMLLASTRNNPRIYASKIPVWSDGSYIWTDGYCMMMRGNVRRELDKIADAKSVAKAKIENCPVYNEAREASQRDYPNYVGILDSVHSEPTEIEFKVNPEQLLIVLKAFISEGSKGQLDIRVSKGALTISSLKSEAIVLKLLSDEE